MPNDDQGGTENVQTTPAAPEQPEFAPITSQDELNRIIGERLARERAKFSDYEEIKAKAAKFDEAEEASKSELEKANERNKQLATELEEYRLAALKSEVAEANNVPAPMAKFLQGFTREELEASAAELSKFVGQTRPPVIRTAGRNQGDDITADNKAFLEGLLDRSF